MVVVFVSVILFYKKKNIIQRLIFTKIIVFTQYEILHPCKYYFIKKKNNIIRYYNAMIHVCEYVNFTYSCILYYNCKYKCNITKCNYLREINN